jgi:hypothetical protein
VIARRIQSGQLSVVEDGRRFVFGHRSPQATVVVGSAGFAERPISDVQFVLAKPEPLEQPAAVAPAPSRGAVARAGSSRVTVE